VRTLAELGATVDQIDPGFADCSAAFHVHWTSGAYNALRRLPEAKLALVDAPLRRWFEAGSKWSLEQYLDAVGARQALGEHMRRFHEKWDLLATPALAVPAFEVGRIVPAGPQYDDPDDWTTWTPFSYPFNLTQQPALSVPCGFTREGLPVGLQLVAPQYHENLALRAAHAFQQATDHLKRPPL
jgi:aspartyl-tRNA(Asn)/glutamyl-tRNA(Gln) amidotransferase subunit A